MEEGARIRKEQDVSSSSDEEEDAKDPTMTKFLKAIELIDENEVKTVKINYGGDLEEEKHQAEWSPLYYSLENVEKLLVSKVAQQLLTNE